jgi:hypothetical protein
VDHPDLGDPDFPRTGDGVVVVAARSGEEGHGENGEESSGTAQSIHHLEPPFGLWVETVWADDLFQILNRFWIRESPIGHKLRGMSCFGPSSERPGAC